MFISKKIDKKIHIHHNGMHFVLPELDTTDLHFDYIASDVFSVRGVNVHIKELCVNTISVQGDAMVFIDTSLKDFDIVSDSAKPGASISVDGVIVFQI